MSIYAQLLSDALGQNHSDDSSTTADAMAHLVKARDRLSANRSSYTEPDWASAAVADQLAYDVALIELARLLGIEVKVVASAVLYPSALGSNGLWCVGESLSTSSMSRLKLNPS